MWHNMYDAAHSMDSLLAVAASQTQHIARASSSTALTNNACHSESITRDNARDGVVFCLKPVARGSKSGANTAKSDGL